ncbi:MAG: cytochrome c oxidase subunit II [Candidatus Eremiobacteraeota bacterium]|nr:cytochrome c oxidase subunit II [Candidatus Eremiobacteraeota bacterium]
MQWLANPASSHGLAMRADWYVFIAAGLFVGLFVYACIFWCLIAYRRSRNGQPAQFSGNPPLEILYVAVPLLMVVGLFGVTFAIEVPVDHVAAAPPNRVSVTAFRWSWRFEYPNGTTIFGTPGAPPTLYLPVAETTEIDLRSADVTHSFWVPAFLFKRDAIPGMTNVFDLAPNRLGRFPARCAQFCGLDHALMTFLVAVVPRIAYERYLASNGAAVP